MLPEALSSLVFACGHHVYAVPAERASEIITFGELTALPSSAPHLRGLFALRGEVIPVIDLGVLRDGTGVSTQRAILVRAGKGAFALTATRVFGVGPLSGQGRPLADSGFEALLRGPVRVRDQEAALIDLDRLLEFLGPSAQRGSSST